ncbi:MAG TPA: hypothetical protein VFM54_13040 [Micromonosporaceae bacterium]|nr:hypothetical protein [Micromonosporaceae bacterium]
MPRPRGLRRPVAAGLRQVAALALRGARAIARDEPGPAGTPAGPGAGGPPEHWRALVAARAPALLRGEGIGLRRRPAGAVPAVRPAAVPPLGPVTGPASPTPAPAAPPHPRRRGRAPRPASGNSAPPLAAGAVPARPVVRVRTGPRPAPLPTSLPTSLPALMPTPTPEATGPPVPAVPAARTPAGPATAAGRRPVPGSERAGAGEPGQVVEVPPADGQPVPAYDDRADPAQVAVRSWPPLPQQEPAASPPGGPVPPAAPLAGPFPAATPGLSPAAMRVASPAAPSRRPAAAPPGAGRSRAWHRPAEPEPYPWPDLPDDSSLWTLPPVAHDAARVRRLEREQAGR